MTIKHAKDTYSSFPIEPKANPLNSEDGIPCWAGKLTEPMPAHPMPQPATAGEEDDFTPEKWLAEQEAKRTQTKRIIAIGKIQAGQLVELTVDQAITALKAAEVGVIADKLETDAQKDIHAAAVEVRNADVHAFEAEMLRMNADLAALRAQLVEPVVRLSDAQLKEIEAERIGEHFSTHPFDY